MEDLPSEKNNLAFTNLPCARAHLYARRSALEAVGTYRIFRIDTIISSAYVSCVHTQYAVIGKRNSENSIFIYFVVKSLFEVRNFVISTIRRTFFVKADIFATFIAPAPSITTDVFA